MTRQRARKGSGTLFQTLVNGKPAWQAAMTVKLPDGTTKKIRGTGPTPQIALQRRSDNISKHMSQPLITTPRTPTSPTISECWANFKTEKKKIKPQSITTYETSINNHIIPSIGDIEVRKLTKKHLQQLFWEELPQKTGHGAISNAWTALRVLLNWAIKQDHLDSNPMMKIDAPNKQTKVAENDEILIEQRVATSLALLPWMKNHEKHSKHYPRVMMMFLALRRSEILGLNWENCFDLDNPEEARIVIRQQIIRYGKNDDRGAPGTWGIQTIPKQKEIRTIYLPEKWRQALIIQREETKNWESPEPWQQDLVFKNPTTKGHTRWTTHDTYWKKTLTEFITKDEPTQRELTETEYFRPHAARHVSNSVLIANGVPPEVAATILGHRDMATNQHYTHQMKIAMKQARKKMNEAWEQQ